MPTLYTLHNFTPQTEWPTPAAFAEHLLARGMELYLRYDRLAIWPKRSLSKLLKAERAYFHAHRPELTELVQAGLQPRLPDEPVAPTAPPPCPYCMRPCVGQENGWYLIYHGNDPQEIRRRQEARAQRDAFDRATWHLHNEVQW